MSKYHSYKVTIDDITFDSKKEAKRYTELRELAQQGIITGLELQKRFELIPSQWQVVNGKKRCIERACNYVADFYYHDGEKWVVEDVKGMKTDVYKIKKKLMLFIHGIIVKEI